jgi:nitrite reductase/ring-hydroxylating ferredoxin subunit/uncharacterized membrane protein
MARDVVDELIEQQPWLDQVADTIQPLVGNTLTASPLLYRVKDVLNGVWLRHSLHAVLTDVPIGAFTLGLLVDGLAIRDHDDSDVNMVADTLLATGLLAALPTAAAGLADWSEIGGQPRRVGVAHALLNTVGLVLNALSLFMRWNRGNRNAARALSGLAFLIMSGGAYLGGHLVYRLGTAVSRDAFVDGPDKYQPVEDAAELEEGRMQKADLNGRPVVLLKEGRKVYCFDGTCPHFGCGLWEGELDGHTVTCPCHGSQFDVTTGAIKRGPTTHPVPVYQTRTRAGKVEVRLAGADSANDNDG